MAADVKLSDLIAEEIERRAVDGWPIKISTVVRNVEAEARRYHIETEDLRRMAIAYALNIGANVEFD